MTVEQLWQPVPGGSGTYIRALAAELAARPEISVTGVRARGQAGSSHLPEALPLAASRLPRWALYEAWGRLRQPTVPRTAAMRRGGLTYDLVHATTWAIPPRSAPLVVTVHDVAFLRSPEHFTRRGVAFFERALRTTAREADAVIVPSLATRDDCVAAGIDPELISVIHHGTSPETTTADEVRNFRTRHGLDRDFVLWCGTLEPRKNIAALLRAYALLLEQDTALDLVLVGPHGWGDASAEVASALTTLPTGRVHVLGSVSHRDLQLAYAAARVFCFPSLWEGFGMPVLEAMAHGTPVVTSRGTSMAEVSGQGALLVDPSAPETIAAAVARAAGTDHARLSAAALTNSARYSWARSADLHLEVYRAAIDRASSGRRT